jgi:hypothetical protein
VTDSTAEAVSGMPERANAGYYRDKRYPTWPLIVIGAFIFLFVLGFNLLGEDSVGERVLRRIRHRRSLVQLAGQAYGRMSTCGGQWVILPEHPFSAPPGWLGYGLFSPVGLCFGAARQHLQKTGLS